MDNRETELLEMQKFIRKEMQKKHFRAVDISSSKEGAEVKMMGLKLNFNGKTCRALLKDGFVIEMPPKETEFLHQLFFYGPELTPAEFRDYRAGKLRGAQVAAKMPEHNVLFDVIWNMLEIRLGVNQVAEKGQKFNTETLKQLSDEELLKAKKLSAEKLLSK